MVPESVVAKASEYDLVLNLTNKSSIHVKGGDDDDARRGPALKFLGFDEAQDFDPDDFDVVFRPLLSGANGSAIIGGTKKPKNWFKKQWLQVEKGNIRNSQAFWFPSDTNPTIPSQEFLDIKDDLTKKGKLHIWHQEYVADPHTDDGEQHDTKYSEFERVRHVKDPMIIPKDWRRFAGLDWGIDHPTACVWSVIGPKGYVWAYDCIKLRGMSVEQVSKVLKEKTNGIKIEAYILDPSCWKREYDGSSIAATFEKNGIHVIPGKKEDKNLSGCSTVKNYLKPVSGEPRIGISSECNDLIREFENLTWDMKTDDDLTDGLRYLLVFLSGLDWTHYLVQEKQKNQIGATIFLERAFSGPVTKWDDGGYIS